MTTPVMTKGPFATSQGKEGLNVDTNAYLGLYLFFSSRVLFENRIRWLISVNSAIRVGMPVVKHVSESEIGAG